MQSYALDQASPRTLSAPVLLYHGLGAVFGNDPVQARLPEELAQRAREVLIVHAEALRMPDLMLILRRSENPDAMGSFMGAVPIGLLPDELDPVATRRALVEGGLNSLEAGGAEAVAAWIQLGAIASGGLSPEERQRYIALLRQTDLWAFGFDGQQANFVRWRVLIAPAAAAYANWAAVKLTELAGACRRNLQHKHGELASAALAELVSATLKSKAILYSP